LSDERLVNENFTAFISFRLYETMIALVEDPFTQNT